MLQVGSTTKSGIYVESHRPEFSCFGDAYTGRGPEKNQRKLLVEVRSPVKYLGLDLRDVPHVLVPEVCPPETKGTQLLAFPWGGYTSGAEWLDPRNSDSDAARDRLVAIARMIEDHERSSAGGQPYFNPFVAPSRIVVDENGRPFLLGGAYEFEFRGESSFPEDLGRYVDPKFVQTRELKSADRSGYVPSDDGLRRRHMRYGLGVMIWEAATGREQHPAASEARPALDDAGSKWPGAPDLIMKCLGFESWREGAGLADTVASELGRAEAGSTAYRPSRGDFGISGSETTGTSSVSGSGAYASGSGTFDDAELAGTSIGIGSSGFSDDMLGDDEPPFAETEPRPFAPTSPPANESRISFMWVAATFVVGLLIPVCFYWYHGLKPWKPGELRDLRAEVVEKAQQIERLEGERDQLSADNAELRTSLTRSNEDRELARLLGQWSAGSAEIEQRIREIDAENLNLRYLHLLDALGDPAKVSECRTELSTLRQALANAGPIEQSDPRSPWFTKDDLDSIETLVKQLGQT